MKKLWLLLLLLCGFLSATAQLSEQRRLALDYYEEKEYEIAIAYLEAVLKEESRDPYLLSVAATCYFHTGQFRNAQEKYRLALLYTPHDDVEERARLTSNLSAALAKQGEKEKAFGYAEQAYRLSPNAHRLWNVLSTAQGLNKWDVILDQLDKAKVATTDNFLFFAGAAYYHKNDMQAAIRTLETFYARYDPDEEFKLVEYQEDGKAYLFHAYLRLIKQKETAPKEQDQLLAQFYQSMQRIHPLTWREYAHPLFFQTYNVCFREDLSAATCRKLTDALLPLPSPAEQALTRYFLDKNPRAAYEATDRLLSAGKTGSLTEELKITRYLSYLEMLLLDFKKHNEQVNEAMLAQTKKLAAACFETGKSYTHEDLFGSKKLTPARETFVVAKRLLVKSDKSARLLEEILRVFPFTAENSDGLLEVLNKSGQ